MFDISVETYADAKVHVIKVNSRLFRVRMHNVQEGLGVKNISDLVRTEIHGIFEAIKPTKDQIRKYKRLGREWFSFDVYTYVSSDLLLKIIKNCRCEKRRGKKKIR